MIEDGSDNKIACVLKVLKSEFDLGTDYGGWVDIPASKFEVCGLTFYEIKRFLKKLVGNKVLVDVDFIYGEDAQYDDEYDYDVCKVRFPNDFVGSVPELQGGKLIMRKKGDFYYNGALIEMSKNTHFFYLLEILFTKADQNGFVSYEDIENGFIARGLEESINSDARNKRISNARDQLFYLARVNGNKLANKNLDGKELMENVRGEGLNFNNHSI